MSSIMEKVENVLSRFEAVVGELENILDAEDAASESGSTPSNGPRIQGRLRGSTFHLQNGVQGDYTKADINLSSEQADTLYNIGNAGGAFVPSLAGSGRNYLLGVVSDGKVTFGGVTFTNPFVPAAPASNPVSNKKSGCGDSGCISCYPKPASSIPANRSW